MATWAPLERFFEQGRQQGLFIDLPILVLQALSLDCVANLAAAPGSRFRIDAGTAGDGHPGQLECHFNPNVSSQELFMKKWMAIMLLIALALFGSVIGFNMFKQKKIAEFMANRPEPEFPVTAMVTKAQDWVPTIEAIGFIEPNQGVTLSSELSGTIDSIRFESGHMSKRINCC
jgi:hypothetical protein